MPGLGERTAQGIGALVTADRATDVAFDMDESVLVEPPFALRRYGSQIVPEMTFGGDVGAQEVEMLSSQYWILKPQQEDISKLHETTLGGGWVMLLSEFNTTAAVKQEPLFRVPTEIPGITGGAGVALNNNDLFFTLRRTAGATWATPLTGLGYVPITLLSLHVAVDPMMEATTLHNPDQGYYLRWQCSGTQRHAPDNLIVFYWGGPLLPGGFGEYCLTFHGSGLCVLSEYANGAWVQRDEWRYCLPHQVMDAAHTMRILPHMRKFMEFRSEVNENVQPVLYGNRRDPNPYAAPREQPRVNLYVVNPSATGQGSLHPFWVTGAGRVKFDVRRDQRLAWQVSQIRYPVVGSLADSPFVVPLGMDNTLPFNIRTDYFKIKAMRQADPEEILADIDTTVFNVQTGLPLTAHASGGFQLPGDENQLEVVFTFSTSDILYTPFLRGFSAERAGTTGTKSIGITTGGQLTDCQITGPTADPTHETASLTIEDTLNELASLRQRGGQNVRVQTTYDPTDLTKKSILIAGRVGRADARLLGYHAGQGYPDPDWRQFEIQVMGEWQRLADQIMLGQFNFAEDRTAPVSEWENGTPPAWKISEIVRVLLNSCGYPDNQIDVAPIATTANRLPVDKDAATDYLPLPFTAIGDYIQRILRDYLGGYLAWDANSINGGLRGMWRARFAPQVNAGDVPVWSFSNDAPVPLAGVTLTGRPEAYGAKTSPIHRGSFRTYPIPPEANTLIVTTTGDLLPNKAQTNLTQWLINYRSYNPPGGPGIATPGPANPDYLGRFVPLVITDPAVAPGKNAAERQAALDLFCRRIYNIACRASELAEWESDLVLITDATDTLLDRKRPLRYGDFVRVDGVDFILRSCNPSFRKDSAQLAVYSAEIYRAPD